MASLDTFETRQTFAKAFGQFVQPAVHHSDLVFFSSTSDAQLSAMGSAVFQM
jgi:hypothetical protein